MGGVGLEAESPNAERRDFIKSGVLVSRPVRFISGTRRERQEFKVKVTCILSEHVHLHVCKVLLILVGIGQGQPLSIISSTIQVNIL